MKTVMCKFLLKQKPTLNYHNFIIVTGSIPILLRFQEHTLYFYEPILFSNSVNLYQH